MSETENVRPGLGVPEGVLAHWRAYAAATPRAFGTGLINRTFLVEGEAGRAVLQELHPVFAPPVNEDLDAVTSHVAKKGLATPRLLRTDEGKVCVVSDGGRPWRMISWIDGTSFDRIDSLERARAAGALVARFHAAVEDLAWSYRHVRAGVHDTRGHLVKLARSLARHRGHRLAKEVAPLGEAILQAGMRLPDLTHMPLRHVHGDLKISNLLFDDTGRGICLVDLDTLGKMPWAFEMGDALRSWCNPGGEDVTDAHIDLDVFRAALAGYFEERPGPFITPDESEALVDGLQTICVELAARFCADAVNESYFGFDARRFATRGEHNLLRARGQWTLAQSVAKQAVDLKAMVSSARAGVEG